MIRAEWKAVPDFDPELLTEHSRRELAEAGGFNGMAAGATAVYDDDKFLLAFTINKPKNFLEPGEIFLLVGREFSARYVRQAKAFIQETAAQFCGLRTCVNVDFRRGCRFAEFLGFRSRGEPFNHAGHRFQIYEVF